MFLSVTGRVSVVCYVIVHWYIRSVYFVYIFYAFLLLLQPIRTSIYSNIQTIIQSVTLRFRFTLCSLRVTLPTALHYAICYTIRFTIQRIASQIQKIDLKCVVGHQSRCRNHCVRWTIKFSLNFF